MNLNKHIFKGLHFLTPFLITILLYFVFINTIIQFSSQYLDVLYKSFYKFNFDTVFLITYIIVFLFFLGSTIIGYYFSFRIIKLLLCLWVIYFFDRYAIFNSFNHFEYFYFKHLKFNSFTYLDFLNIIPIYSLWFYYRYYKVKCTCKKGKHNIGNLLFIDKEIVNPEEDKLERVKYARNIIDKIDWSYNNSSISIAIIGKWGEGKSSFLNILYSLFQKKKNLILVKFNPWSNYGVNTMQNGFFNSLKNEIKFYNGEVANLIDHYLRKINNNSSSYLKTATSIIAKDEVFYLEEIRNVIKSLNKKIIIFIDDIDRLIGNEINEVLGIIRNVAAFENTIFIVGLDKDYVNSIIKHSNKTNRENYLDKIFDYEFCLPPYPERIKSDLLKEIIKLKKSEYYNEIEKLLNNKNPIALVELVKPEEEPEFKHNYTFNNIINNSLKTLRDVKKFANILVDGIDLLGKNVNIRDLFFVNLIKYKNGEIYNLLSNKLIIEETVIDDRVVNIFSIEKLMSFYPEEKGNVTYDFALTVNLLYSLFVYSEETDYKSIKHPSRLPLFFEYNAWDTISIEKYLDLRAGYYYEFEKEILKYHNEHSNIIGIIDDNQNFDTKIEFDNTLKVILALLSNSKNYPNSLFFDLLKNDQVDRISKNFFENDLSKFAANLKEILISEYNLGVSKVIMEALYKYATEDFKFVLSKDDLISVNITALKYYTTVIKPTDNFNVFNILSSSVDRIFNGKAIYNEEVLSWFKEYLKNDFTSFLSFVIVPYQVNEEQLWKMHDNFNKIDELNLIPDNYEFEHPSIEFLIYRTFSRAYMTNNNKPIAFDWRHINIVSDNKTEFIKSEKYPTLERNATVVFDHPWNNVIRRNSPKLQTSEWIAHKFPITDREAKNGGEYILKRIFILPFEIEKITKATIFLYVDDLCDIQLNNNKINNEKINTGDKVEYSKTIIEYLQTGINEIEFFIENADFSKSGRKSTTGFDNPYGIIYNIEIELKEEIKH